VSIKSIGDVYKDQDGRKLFCPGGMATKKEPHK